jgi:PAS domain S-box-containing protein
MPDKSKEQPAEFALRNIKIQPGDIVILLDQLGRVTGWNQVAKQVLGYKAAEVKGLPWDGLFPYSGLNVKAVLAGRDFAGGFEAIRKDKTPVELYFFATAVKDKTGQVTGIACIGRDVSPFWRPTEEALEQEKKYRLLFALSVDGVVILSSRGEIIEANPSAARFAGLPLEQLIDQPVDKFIPPEQFREALAFWLSLLRKGKRQETLRVRSATGEERRLFVQGAVLETRQGKRIFVLCRDVTTESQTETAWREAEVKFRTVFESGAAARFIVTLDGTIVETNEAGARLFGLRREKLLGRRLREIVPEELKAILPQIRTALLEQRFHQVEVVTRRQDGTELWLVVSSSLIELDERTLILTMLKDITEERKALRESKENEARLNLLLSQVPAVIWQTDNKLRITSVAGSGLAFLGIKPAEVLKKGIRELLGDKDEIEQAHRRALAGESALFEFERRARVYQARVEPRRGVEGEVLGVVGLAQDVTEKRETGQRLAQALSQYQTLVENLPILIGVHQDGRVVMINKEGARLLGYDSPAEVIGMSVLDIVHPDDWPVAVSRIRAALEQGVTNPPIEERFRRKDGSYFLVEVRSAPFVWNGRAALLVIGQDLSEKKQLSERVQDILSHTRAMLQYAPHGIVAGSEGRIVYANPAFARLFGYEPEEVVGKLITELLPVYELERLQGYQEARAQGRPAPAEYQFDGLCKDGTTRRMSAFVITYKVGDKLYLLGFVNPVKEG